ncbi:MAG: hypothetical protein AB4040_06475 [Synechococcus sp.]
MAMLQWRAKSESSQRKGWQTWLGLLLVCAIALTGCGPSSESNRPASTSIGRGISVVDTPSEIAKLDRYMDGYRPKVAIASPKADQVIQDTQVSVRFEVEDFPLFQDEELGLGPNLHVILDNQPYIPLYDSNQPLVLNDLEPGTHTLRVFAARPWHESYKNSEAYAQTTFHVFTKTPEYAPQSQLPVLTYSTPSETYGAEPILLDYWLANAPIRESLLPDVPKDWRIRYTLNGESSFLDRWQSIYLKGLKPGRNIISVELVDGQGNPIRNVFNSAARTVTYRPGGTDTLSRLIAGSLSAEEALAIVGAIPEPEQPEPTPEPESELTGKPTPEDVKEEGTEISPERPSLAPEEIEQPPVLTEEEKAPEEAAETTLPEPEEPAALELEESDALEEEISEEKPAGELMEEKPAEDAIRDTNFPADTTVESEASEETEDIERTTEPEALTTDKLKTGDEQEPVLSPQLSTEEADAEEVGDRQPLAEPLTETVPEPASKSGLQEWWQKVRGDRTSPKPAASPRSTPEKEPSGSIPQSLTESDAAPKEPEVRTVERPETQLPADNLPTAEPADSSQPGGELMLEREESVESPAETTVQEPKESSLSEEASREKTLSTEESRDIDAIETFDRDDSNEQPEIATPAKPKSPQGFLQRFRNRFKVPAREPSVPVLTEDTNLTEETDINPLELGTGTEMTDSVPSPVPSQLEAPKQETIVSPEGDPADSGGLPVKQEAAEGEDRDSLLQQFEEVQEPSEPETRAQEEAIEKTEAATPSPMGRSRRLLRRFQRDRAPVTPQPSSTSKLEDSSPIPSSLSAPTTDSDAPPTEPPAVVPPTAPSSRTSDRAEPVFPSRSNNKPFVTKPPVSQPPPSSSIPQPEATDNQAGQLESGEQPATPTADDGDRPNSPRKTQVSSTIFNQTKQQPSPDSSEITTLEKPQEPRPDRVKNLLPPSIADRPQKISIPSKL